MPYDFDVESARKEGYTDSTIAEYLSDQTSFDLPGARKAGHKDIDVINYITGKKYAPAQFNAPLGEADAGILAEQTTGFGKAAEVLSAPNYAMAQGVSAAIKGEPILPAMKKGFLLQDPKVFGDVIAENMPYAFADPTTSAVIQTLGGLVFDVALDPLTFLGGAGGKALTQAKKLGRLAEKSDLLMDLGRIFSNEVGSESYKKAYQILSQFENIKHSRTGKAIDEMVALDKQIVSLAKETGEDAHVLRSRIIDSVEKRTRGENTTINEIASYLQERNKAQLVREQELGLATREISKETSGVDYFIHAITPTGKKWLEKHGGKEFRGISRTMSDKHASMIQRKYGGMTVEEVNDLMRQQGFSGDFFMKDPARGQAIRDIRHARSITGAEFQDEMARNFGVRAEEATQDLVSVAPERLKGYRFEPDVASIIDLHHQKFVNPQEVNSVLRVYDDVQNWWKRWTLGVFPAYHTRNMAGNIWNNSLAGVRNPLRYKDAYEIQRGFNGTLKTATGSIDYKDIYEMARDRGVLGRGFYGGDIPSAIDDALMKGKWLTVGSNNKLVRGGMKVGRAIEENARLAHFVDKLSKGMSPDDAARSVKKFLFDYTELTPTEQNVFKRVMPFYQWSRKNIPLQLEMFVRRPGQQMIPIKFKHEMERLTAGDRPPPEANISEFLTGDYAIRVGGRTQEGTWPYAPIAGYLPWGDLPRWVNSPAETFAYMVSPLIKEPIQQIVNYDLFFRRKIAHPDLEQAFMYPTGNQDFVRFMGARLSPRAAHVLRNIRLLSTIDRANPFNVFGEDRIGVRELSPGQKAAQYILGIRNYNQDELKGLVYGLVKEKRRIEDLNKDLKFLARELSRVKDPTTTKDIRDRMQLIIDAQRKIATEEVQKHIPK